MLPLWRTLPLPNGGCSLDKTNCRWSRRVEAIILCSIQASGESSFARERWYESHVRINLDMLRTRNREDIVLFACLAAKTPVVIDNTKRFSREANPRRAQRVRNVT